MEEYTELDIGEVRAGYCADEDGLTMWKGHYLTREAEARISWEDARFYVNSYMEDGVYLLPGEKAEQIDTGGIYQQLDLFSMFSEQVGGIAAKKRSRALSRQKRKNRSCQRTCCQKNSLTQSCGVGAAGITAASAFMRSTSRARHRRKWQNFSGKNTKLPEKALNLKENSYPYGSMSRE